jgi:outer membrane protein, heavy metal efflux system
MPRTTAFLPMFGWLWLAVLAAGCCWSNKPVATQSPRQPLACPSACLAPPSTQPYWVSPPPSSAQLASVGASNAFQGSLGPSGPAAAMAPMQPAIEPLPPAAPQQPAPASVMISVAPIKGQQAAQQIARQTPPCQQTFANPQAPTNPQIVSWPPTDGPMTGSPAAGAVTTSSVPATAVRQVSADGDLPPAAGPPLAEAIPTPHPRRLEVPSDLPGANAPQIHLPPLDREHAQERGAAVAKLYPPLPPLGAEYQAAALPTGKPLSIYDLEQMARDYSPQIRQAVADVRSAEGAAIQAGLYPNPTAGYEGDDINQAQTRGQQGGFVDQVVKTGGKLQLAKAAAQVDVANAQVALRKAQSDLASKVRGAYFSTLVAQENVRICHALAQFSDEAYKVQVDMVEGGQAAAYEPLQLRVLAYQARAALVQARNRYISAWKQLAATMGLPGLPPAPLVGGVDAPVPIVRYDMALAHILSMNSDVITAENTLRQSRINLRLAQVNRIPDLDAHVVIQRDFTTPPFGTIVGVSLGGPLPLWDRNQGNIMSAEAAVSKASEGPHFVRDDLTSRLADAYERYQDNLKVIDYYRKWMLPDQVQAYRGAYQRHQTQPDVVAFADVVTAQQTLATTVTSYVTALGSLWQAVVDVGNLLETEDLFRMGDPQSVPPVPDLASLCPLPCCHSSQPAAAAGWLRGDGQWPALAPGEAPRK